MLLGDDQGLNCSCPRYEDSSSTMIGGWVACEGGARFIGDSRTLARAWQGQRRNRGIGEAIVELLNRLHLFDYAQIRRKMSSLDFDAPSGLGDAQ